MTDLAIMISSSGRMTHTLTRPASDEISGAFFAFQLWFRSMIAELPDWVSDIRLFRHVGSPDRSRGGRCRRDPTWSNFW